VWSPVYVDAMIARDRDTDANGSLDERLYAAHDANFNVVALVDTSGAVVERFAYDAFGVFSVLTPAWGSRASSNYDWVYLHQGGRWDAELAGYSFRNREYSPILGRWFRNDPIGFDGNDVNFYRALSNKPTSALDPMGLESWQEYSYSKGSIRFKFYYKGFSLDQRGQLVRAMIGAFEAIDAAWVDLYFLREGMKKDKNKLSDDNKLTLHRFNQFFCDDNTTVPRSCVEQVQSMLWKMRKGIKGESFDLYIYYDPAEPDHGAWERVRGRMRLGPVFFGKTYTLEQRIATLVHELSHAYGLADDDGGAWTGGFGSNATFDKNPLKTAMRCKSAYAIEAFVDHYYIRKNTKP
jgi:RHS repeat-associated protein